MRNLWNIIPPPKSDTHGLLEIVKGSDGCGIIDDGGAYRTSGGHGQSRDGQSRDGQSRDGEHRGGEHGHGRSGRGHGRGGSGHGGPRGQNSRVIASNITNEDIISGTRKKVLAAFKEAKTLFDPKFALFSAGPCGGMIGTDLDEIADTVAAEYDIPTAVVNMSGQSIYDVGVSKTTLVLAQLLAQESNTERKGVNILGATALDWDPEDMEALKTRLAEIGYPVIAQPGGTVTTEQMKAMGNAKINLAVTRAGLEAAKMLNTRFNTPFIAMAPFGEENLKQVIRAVEEGGIQPAVKDSVPADGLIISEQFIGNAVRQTLESGGLIKSGDVATMFQFDKAYARGNDKRLKGEDDVREFINNPQYKFIVADPIFKPFLQRDCKWIDLPHKAQSGHGGGTNVPLLGSKLDQWLKDQI